MNKYYILIFIFLLQSCNSLDGELQNFKNHYLRDKKGSHIELPIGQYEAQLILNSNRIFSINYLNHTFEFHIPKDISFSDEDSEVYLAPAQVRQRHGVFAKLATSVYRGELIRETENCSWVERYTSCDYDGVCRDQFRTRYGTKEVSFSNNTYYKFVTLNLRNHDSGEVISQLTGQKKIVRKEYRYESICN